MDPGIGGQLWKAVCCSGFVVGAARAVPFGPVKDVLPYLIRRAEENTSVEGQTVRELELLQKERKRRKIN